MAIVAAAIFVACWSAALLVVVVDPLDLYPWGGTIKFRQTDYAKGAIPYILKAAIEDKANDAFLIGGSTSVGFTRAMLDSSFPDVHHAFNLSYGAPRPLDQALVEKMVAHRVMEHDAPVKRVLLAIDWIHMLTRPAAEQLNTYSQFPFHLYDNDHTNDVRMVGSTTLALAFEVLRAKPIWRPDWSSTIDQRTDEHSFKTFQSPASLRRLSSIVRQYRDDVDMPADRNCGDFFTIADQIVPLAKTLADAKVPLDIYFPPYSLVYYYEWRASKARGRLLDKSILEDQILFRKCLVKATARIPGVRVFRFDDDAAIVGDLGNYREAAHVQNEAIYREILQWISKDEHRLTLGNVDADGSRLRAWVRNYRLYDTADRTENANKF